VVNWYWSICLYSFCINNVSLVDLVIMDLKLLNHLFGNVPVKLLEAKDKILSFKNSQWFSLFPIAEGPTSQKN
jgi:hypothetical protein